VRPTSAIESLRVQVRQIEGRHRRATTVLPWRSLLWTRGFPGGGLLVGALHEVAGGGNGAIDVAALPASPRAHEERCSGVSLDPICSRQPSRKPA
jgi:hypothetical protein